MEKIYTIPLRDAFKAPRTKRANKAVKIVKKFLAEKLRLGDVKLDSSVNNALWNRGIGKPPRRIKVGVTREGDSAIVKLAE
ncbi:MAG TPA: 50S ribosomal protein L31e [Candidatus Altiarchaeales archaeon]|nr:50S ribosomal protein L31e [Candidatus Altiarchaeales archaeon]